MHLILTGATGLVGSCVLDAMLKNSAVTRVSIISRRPVQMAIDAKDEARVRVFIHTDFATYGPDLLEQLRGADGCVWALGIAQAQVSKEEYIVITKTFALAFANAFISTLATPNDDTKEHQAQQQQHQPFNFVYVAGGGTTTQPGLFTMFQGRIKGETEIELSKLRKANPMFQACSVRPFYVDMRAHLEIKPYVSPRILLHKASDVAFGSSIRRFGKDYWSPTKELGEFLTELAMGQHLDALEKRESVGLEVEMLEEFPIWSNQAMRKLKGY